MSFLSPAGDPFPSGLIQPTAPTDFQQQLFQQIPGLFQGGDFTKNPLFQQSIDILSRTAEGFDPFEDKRLKAFKDNLREEVKRAKDRIAARTSAKDRFESGGAAGRTGQEGEVEEQGIRDIGQLAANLEAQSRQQAIAAAQILPQLARFQTQAPIDFLQQGIQVGDIPRNFEEQLRVAELNELLRQRGELASTVGPALQTSSFSPPLAFDVFSSTPGLLGGPSGIGLQSDGGVNRGVQMTQAGLGALAGAGGGGGFGGAAIGALGGQGGSTLEQMLLKILGGQIGQGKF